MSSVKPRGAEQASPADGHVRSRRNLLKSSMALGAGVSLSPSLGHAAERTTPPTAQAPSDGRLDPASYKTFEIDGHKMNVFDEGDPSLPTVVMFHGSPHSSQEYRYNIPALRAAGYRVIAPDHLGAGGSDRSTDPSLYSSALDYQRSLKLVDAMGLDKFYALGGDRGSIPVWLLAAFNPERILGVIAENISHINGWALTGIEQKRRSWYMWYFQFDVARAELEANDWALARGILEHHPDFDDFILPDWNRPNGIEANWLNWYRASVHPDKAGPAQVIPNVSAPVLLLYSMNDPYVGPEQLATSQQSIKGPFEMLRIDGAGHFIARNAPKQYNAAVIDFLNRQQARRAPA